MDLSKIAKKLKATLADDMEDSPDMTSTGNLAFDLIIDGGMPFGYVVELLGLSASGKSTFIQKIIATAQKKYDAVGVLIDRENAFFKPRAKELGIDTKNLFLAKPKDTPGGYISVYIYHRCNYCHKSTRQRNCNSCCKE